MRVIIRKSDEIFVIIQRSCREWTTNVYIYQFM